MVEMFGTQVVADKPKAAGSYCAPELFPIAASDTMPPEPCGGEPLDGVAPVEYKAACRLAAGILVGSPASQMAEPVAVPTGALAVDVGAATVWYACT
ncbi:hypothetical protein GALL_452240 [mine drainage metagenome]|uniref:Uncharacterized protein n=1 Tax=mine drainage metagenome TaxID=410659 RepID=A0A1J5PZA1_9ZZZZ